MLSCLFWDLTRSGHETRELTSSHNDPKDQSLIKEPPFQDLLDRNSQTHDGLSTFWPQAVGHTLFYSVFKEDH